MTLEYVLLLVAIILCFFKKRSISIFLLSCSVIAAYVYGTIDSYGISTAIGLYAITSVYFQRDIDSKTTKIILLLIILATVTLLFFHLLPGFNNRIVIDSRKISQLSIPYSMDLKFDKTIAGIILFMNSRLYENEKRLHIKSIITTSMLLLLCSTILMTAGILSGYLEFDYKIPDILLLCSINNLFFTCFSEEVVFRGIVQNKLEQLLQSK